MSWRLAPSLQELFDEVDKRYPKHDRSKDGSIGDVAHQHTRSGHNPDSRGVVHAIDVDINNIGDHGLSRIADTVVGDRRLWYVIHDRVIRSATFNWVPQRYNGSDPHTGHVHIEIKNELHRGYSLAEIVAAENDMRTWGVGPTPPTTYLLKSGDTLSSVAATFNVVGGYQALAKTNGIADPDHVPVGLRLVIPGSVPQPKIHLDWAVAAVEDGKNGSQTYALLNYWLPGRGNLTLRYSRFQQSLGYKGTKRGQDADGIPGVSTLAVLAAKHGWGVQV